MIVQKALAGKNLKESQKVAIYLSLFKVFGPIFTVIPGIIAYNYFNGNVQSNDNAYPALIQVILPEWGYGLFGAVIFGAILSSFVGSLNSTTTLFTLDFYKPIFGKRASDQHIARVCHIATVVIGIIVVALSPLIALFPSGLYAIVQQFNGVYSMPVFALVLVAFYSKHTSKLGAKVALFTHIILYTTISFLIPQLNYLYTFSFMFLIDLAIILIFNKVSPSDHFDLNTNKAKVDLTLWKYRYVAGGVVLGLVIIAYIIFSPLVL